MLSKYTGCTRPLKGFNIEKNKNEKPNYKITDYKINHLELVSGRWIPVTSDFKESGNASRIVREYIEIPCGHCPGCKLRAARQWRDRCVAESMYHNMNLFVTLTYDDENVPVAESGHLTLRKSDLQKFFKRLRSNGFEFRYYAACEYGTTTLRPHYHILFFGLDLPDLTSDLDGHLSSKFLTDIWKLGKNIDIQYFSPENASYVARYTLKKAYKDFRWAYIEFGIEPECSLMSRKPGLGSRFYDEKGRYLYENGYFVYASPDGSQRIYPSRFFKKKLQESDPEFFEVVNNNAIDFMTTKRYTMFDGTRQYTDVLKDQEVILSRSIQSLRKREFENA